MKTDLKRVNELEENYPDVDWFAILADGGMVAVEEYAEYAEKQRRNDA